jgi:hypothetical protein
MPGFILKVTPNRDLYVEWSTIVDDIVRIGIRAEFLEGLATRYPDLLVDLVHSPEARLARADAHGTSALPFPGVHPLFGGWDDSGLVVEQRGILRRADLLAYVAAMEADWPEKAYALLAPFDDDEGDLVLDAPG